MLTEGTLSLNSRWTMLSIVALLVIAPMATGSSANAANFSFTQIDVPGAVMTEARGINDAGQIVGLFDDSTGGHGFLDTGGSFTQIDVPGAFGTVASGINDAGQIVGSFNDSTGAHGFLENWRQLHSNRRAGRNQYVRLWH
jgi:probable HAF family extracellular repeat protein